ncbi:GNAT family N-acetyltransferase [Aeromicrobium sp. CTD01-1L150]|uniref:GNAT family N-acetyltransferase n=1 Tax=Aeromicrobium sp. CTD01-1L150 TaxID=3341830 RepID=UPI0035BEF116
MTGIAERIETERLVLRPYGPSDAERVLDVQSRLEVIRWLDNPPYTPMADLEAARQWIDRVLQREHEDPMQAHRAIEVRDTQVVVGGVLVARLERIDSGFVGEYETGWHLNPDSFGHGYATEAAAAMAQAAFGAGHERLVIDMYPDNAPSAAVARRLGAKELGEGPDPWYGDTSLMFELLP